MSQATRAWELSTAQAGLLGVVQGAAELLPISSSGHLVLVPLVLGWPYEATDPELRKSFEVALHIGAAASLALARRRELGRALLRLDAMRAVELSVTLVPTACTALTFEREIERKLGVPSRVARAQILFAAALAAADLRPESRNECDLTLREHAMIGVWQASALVPGVSRSGAALTAARLLSLDRTSAARLSEQQAMPVICAAAALKGLRLLRHPPPRAIRKPLAVGVALSFLSSLASVRLARLCERRGAYVLVPAYRIALGAFALARTRKAARRCEAFGQ